MPANLVALVPNSGSEVGEPEFLETFSLSYWKLTRRNSEQEHLQHGGPQMMHHMHQLVCVHQAKPMMLTTHGDKPNKLQSTELIKPARCHSFLALFELSPLKFKGSSGNSLCHQTAANGANA